MLRLYDDRRRQAVQIDPARRGQLRVYAGVLPGAGGAHLGELRTCLLPDLIRRTAQRHRLSVVLGQDAGEASQADCSALNIRPPDYSSRRDLGDVIDIQVGEAATRLEGGGDRPTSGLARHWLQCGQVRFEGAELTGAAGRVPGVAELARRGLDPLALRLAFLEHHYRQPVDLTWPVLADADRRLRGWREQVADWATHPSRPMPRRYVARIAGAFDDDLDTPAAALALLALARDTEVPPGAKFETFAHLDQLFGLDLVADLGRTPDPLPLPPGAEDLLAERAAARERQDEAGADRLAAELARRRVAVSDTPAGQHWTVDRGL